MSIKIADTSYYINEPSFQRAATSNSRYVKTESHEQHILPPTVRRSPSKPRREMYTRNSGGFVVHLWYKRARGSSGGGKEKLSKRKTTQLSCCAHAAASALRQRMSASLEPFFVCLYRQGCDRWTLLVNHCRSQRWLKHDPNCGSTGAMCVRTRAQNDDGGSYTNGYERHEEREGWSDDKRARPDPFVQYSETFDRKHGRRKLWKKWRNPWKKDQSQNQETCVSTP